MKLAQYTGMVQYIDFFSAEGKTPNVFPSYDPKQSDCKVSVMLELWGIQSTPTLARNGSTW